MKHQRRFYTTPQGDKYPLYEAPYDTAFHVYKSDKRRAIIGDPHSCLLALGIRRDPRVLDAYIGSGRDAYVVFAKGQGKKGPFALHFTVNAEAARMRDLFDTKHAPTSQIILLSAPTQGRTLAARSRMNKRRREEIKNGATVQLRTVHSPRITRLGVPNRPRATITKNTVTVVKE
jgi:hypothetical protein